MNEVYNSPPLLAQKAYDLVIEYIITGKFRMGQYITIADLEKKLAMSRTPIREAFLRLADEGILKRDRKFYCVEFPESGEIEQLYGLRKELEIYSANLAAIYITETQKKELVSVLEELESTTKSNSKPFELSQLNGKFHLTIAKISGNKFLLDELQRLRNHLSVIKILPLFDSENRLIELKQHMDIGMAILHKDPEKAKEFMCVHETDAWNYVKEKVIPLFHNEE